MIKFTVDTQSLSDILDRMDQNSDTPLIRWSNDLNQQFYSCSTYNMLVTVNYNREYDENGFFISDRFTPKCTVQWETDLDYMMFTLVYGHIQLK